MTKPRASKGVIIRDALINYRDRQPPGEIKIYQYSNEWEDSNPPPSSLFIKATSRVDAVVKLYEYFEYTKHASDGYEDPVESYRSLVKGYEYVIGHTSDYIAEELVSHLFDTETDIRLYESVMPVIIG